MAPQYVRRSLVNVMSAVNKSLNISRAIFPFEYFHLSSLSILFLVLSIALLVPLRFLLDCIRSWGQVRLLWKKMQTSLLRSNGNAVELVMTECFLPSLFLYAYFTFEVIKFIYPVFRFSFDNSVSARSLFWWMRYKQLNYIEFSITFSQRLIERFFCKRLLWERQKHKENKKKR